MASLCLCALLTYLLASLVCILKFLISFSSLWIFGLEACTCLRGNDYALEKKRQGQSQKQSSCRYKYKCVGLLLTGRSGAVVFIGSGPLAVEAAVGGALALQRASL